MHSVNCILSIDDLLITGSDQHQIAELKRDLQDVHKMIHLKLMHKFHGVCFLHSKCHAIL